VIDDAAALHPLVPLSFLANELEDRELMRDGHRVVPSGPLAP
jgi:hypothetical protein